MTTRRTVILPPRPLLHARALLHFTPYHRGGSGLPLVCLHGFLDTWRTWELPLPALEHSHDVLAPTLAGHAGGPPIDDELSDTTLADAVERSMDEAGFETAHMVGNSLGGFVALQLAARGRARTVVALAPAGGWAPGARSVQELLTLQATIYELSRRTAPYADAALASPEGRRRATQFITVNYEHIPAELWVELDGVGHCPQLDVPLVTAQLIAGFTSGGPPAPSTSSRL